MSHDWDKFTDEELLALRDEIKAQFKETRRLLDESKSLTDPKRPWVLRMWSTNRALDLLAKAEAAAEKCDEMLGVAPDEIAARWPKLRVDRRFLAYQWFCGICVAVGLVSSLHSGNWLASLAELVCLVVVAMWPRQMVYVDRSSHVKR